MSETFAYRNLISGSFPVVTRSMTVLSGEAARVAGTVMGRITASGKLVICNSAGTDDGRRTPFCVLLQDTDASLADTVAPVALTGQFNENSLVFGGTDTVTTHRDALRDVSIYPESSVSN